MTGSNTTLTSVCPGLATVISQKVGREALTPKKRAGLRTRIIFKFPPDLAHRLHALRTRHVSRKEAVEFIEIRFSQPVVQGFDFCGAGLGALDLFVGCVVAYASVRSPCDFGASMSASGVVL